MWLFVPLTLALLVVLAYGNSLDGDFVLDARVLILEDPRLNAFTPSTLREIFTRSYWWPYTEADDLYRPVTTLSYFINYAILGNGNSATGYHIVNIALHLANVLLVYALALRLMRTVPTAFFMAALWAVHPLTTEAVTNIVGRADLLAALGVLGGLFAYVRAADPGARRTAWLVAGGFAVAIGVFSKESAVAVAGIVGAYDLLVRRPRPSLATMMSGWLMVAVPIAALLYQRNVVLVASPGADTLFVDNPIVGAGATQGALTATAVLGRYLWLMVWPSTLSADYSFAQIPLASGTPTEWVAWITVAAALAATIALVRADRRAAFVAIAAWLAVLPASNLLVTSGTIMGERLVYLSLAGVLALIVGAAFAIGHSPSGRAVVAGLLTIDVIVLTVWTSWRNEDWRNELTLWTAAVQAAPDSFKTHAGLADAIYQSDPNRAQLDRVVLEMNRSVAILDEAPPGGRPWLTYRQAAVYALEYADQLRSRGSNNEREIAEVFERAVSHSRGHIAAVEATPFTGRLGLSSSARARELSAGYGLLTTAWLRLGRPADAIDSARRALTFDPASPLPYRVLAAAQADASRLDDAATTLLTGFLVTGDAPLRESAIELYRSGLDARGCAVRSTPQGPTLDPTCDVVRRHLCAAAVEAAQLQRERGLNDLAGGIEQMARTSFSCGG